jgi:DNA polymerase (family 10)
MADHSRSSYYAGGLTADRVRQQADEIRAIRAELAAEGADFSLLHGIEVDILPDGSLDYEEDILALLDYAVVSVHQQFTLTREAQTERIVRAVQSPYADILGHATGRLLLRRPGYDVDLDAVIEACAQTGTVIEINANPRRLDMDWRWVRVAARRGCMFSIDPDAHHVDGYDDLRYGVTVARKAGLTSAAVVNTVTTADAFLAQLKRVKR